jgi:hypothetical protein
MKCDRYTTPATRSHNHIQETVLLKTNNTSRNKMLRRIETAKFRLSQPMTSPNRSSTLAIASCAASSSFSSAPPPHLERSSVVFWVAIGSEIVMLLLFGFLSQVYWVCSALKRFY